MNKLGNNYNSNLDQYFLTDTKIIKKVIDTFNLTEKDNFIELGAGIGSIAQELSCKCKVTLIDIDSKLIDELKVRFPDFNVEEDDAIEHLNKNNYNKILSSLPWYLSDKLFEAFKNVKFDIACIIVDNKFDYHKYDKWFNISKICNVEADKYNYPPPFDSVYLKITKK